MRHDVRYRLFFNNEPATREQLDRVETITVEQEVDLAWEARLEIPIWLDRRGNWPQADLAFVNSFSRVRVEISIGGNPFVPLCSLLNGYPHKANVGYWDGVLNFSVLMLRTYTGELLFYPTPIPQFYLKCRQR